MIKTYEEILAFNKENVDAVMQSTNTLSKGCEQIAKECFSYFGRSLDNAAENAKKVSACKSAVDVLQLQSETAKNSIEEFVSQSRKVADISNGVAQESIAPLSSRYKVVVDTINSQASKWASEAANAAKKAS